MTKFDLVQATAKKFKITLSQADDIVSYIYETIAKTIASGERVIIPGLGVFGVKERKAKKARNPRTGEEVVVPKRKVVVFRAAKSLKEAVNKK
jgi:DNA-binding protein HU-beta